MPLKRHQFAGPAQQAILPSGVLMDRSRKQRILEKLAFDLSGAISYLDPARNIRVQTANTVAGTQKVYDQGGTRQQKITAEQYQTSYPITGQTLKSRLQGYIDRDRAPSITPWSVVAGGGTPEFSAPIYYPPQTTGYAQGDRALEVLRNNAKKGFGITGGDKIDCTHFTNQIQGGPYLDSAAIYRDATTGQKVYRRIPHEQMVAGDVITYPTHGSNYGHAATYAGNGRIIDAGWSGNGPQYRALPPDFGEHDDVIVARRVGTTPVRTGDPSPLPSTPLTYEQMQAQGKPYPSHLAKLQGGVSVAQASRR